MEITVQGQKFKPKFNIGFVNRLDKNIQGEIIGQKFGISLIDAKKGLENKSLIMLVDVLKAALPFVKQPDIEDAIEAIAEEAGDLDAFFEEVLNEMGESAVLKSSLKKQLSMDQDSTKEISPEFIASLMK